MSDSLPVIADPSQEKRRELLARLKQRQNSRENPQTKHAAMSFAQQRLWFFDQLAPGTPLYNVPSANRLQFPVDQEALLRTLNEIVRRHESLRTTFGTRNGSPVQIIHSELLLDLSVEDLQSVPEGERESEALRLATEEGQTPFNLRTGPLIRSRLLRLGEQDYLFLITLHHIVSDGWSMGLFFKELNSIYAEFVMGRPSPLPDLQIQYADFAEWQRKSLQGEVLEKQLTYWKSRLSGLARLELPADRGRPAVTSFRGADLALHIDEELVTSLRKLSADHNATLFMTVLSAFQLLLHRYTGQDDIAVGSPVANRNRAEIEGLIGFFVNSLVMRTSFAGDPSFSELLGRVKEAAVEAYANQDLPFEMLVDELRPERDLSRNPLFEVMFQLITVPSDPGATSTPSPAARLALGTAIFDLNFNLFETEGKGISGVIEYSTDLFNADRITRMAGHFRMLLEGIASNPLRKISEVPILTPSERRQILTRWNATQITFLRGQTVIQIFESWAVKQPNAPAVCFQETLLSYSELNRKVNQLAHHLLGQGVTRGDTVAVCLERSIDFVVACVAALKTGAAYLPFDPGLPGSRLTFLVEDSQAAAIITTTNFADTFNRMAAKLVFLDTDAEAVARQDAGNPAIPLRSEDLAYVIYTSGSTGQPKGTEIQHGSLANLVHWHVRNFKITPRDREALLTGLGFDGAVCDLWSTLGAGASLQIAEDEVRYSPKTLSQWLSHYKVTICFVPAPILEMVLEGPWEPGCSLRALMTGGDKVHRGVRAGLPFSVFNMYGPTEYSVIATHAQIPENREDGVAPPIGRPIANTEVYVVDSHGQVLPVGVPGELWISGAGLARGYRNREEMTKERFVPHPVKAGKLAYRTGDLVRYRADGLLEFIGRLDRQVKVRGFRIEPEEIEATIAGMPGVKSCAVTVLEEAGGEKRLVAYVVPDQEKFELATLREWLREKIPAYMVPADFAVVEKLPLTANGKVDLAALPPPSGRERQEYVPPQNQLELKIAGIWQEELKIAKVGIDENFFDLGGNSLTLVRIHSRLCEGDSEIKASVIDLFRHPTIRALAQFLRSKQQPSGVVGQAQEHGARQREALVARNATRRSNEPRR